jgi:heptosyltransferase I
VDRYDDAARRFLGKGAGKLRWGTKIERAGVMELISVADVTDKLDTAIQGGARPSDL